jgi:hypothetical protein
MSEIKSIEVAAALYGCKADELMGFSEKDDGALVIIAPDGKKFRYDKVLADAQRAEMEEAAKPKPKPAPKRRTTTRRRTTAKKINGKG